MTSSSKTILSIGAGPRGIATSVQAKILRDCGYDAPDVILVDAHGPGTNWTGQNGYTDGDFPLDTNPLKDLSFPPVTVFGREFDARLAEYSWYSYARRAGVLDDWVSRGTGRISHSRFGAYLDHAVQQSGTDLKRGRVTRIGFAGNQARVTIAAPATGETDDLTVDGILVCGPGEPVTLPGQSCAGERVFTGKSYWECRDLFQKAGTPKIAIIGTGQSAGTIGCSLLRETPGARLEFFSPLGFLPVQSSGFHENALCSASAEDWTSIPVNTRINIVRRINNGVMEGYIKQVLDQSDAVGIVAARARRLIGKQDRVDILTASGDVHSYDFVIVAAGFDPMLQVERLLGPNANEDWLNEMKAGPIVDHNLRLPDLPAAVHVPALAGLSQGPGLSLLSCLTTMAGRVISAHMPVYARERAHA